MKSYDVTFRYSRVISEFKVSNLKWKFLIHSYFKSYFIHETVIAMRLIRLTQTEETKFLKQTNSHCLSCYCGGIATWDGGRTSSFPLSLRLQSWRKRCCWSSGWLPLICIHEWNKVKREISEKWFWEESTCLSLSINCSSSIPMRATITEDAAPCVGSLHPKKHLQDRDGPAKGSKIRLWSVPQYIKREWNASRSRMAIPTTKARNASACPLLQNPP